MTVKTTHAALINAQRILDSLSLPVMMLDRNLHFVYANKAYLKAVQRPWLELNDVYVFDAFPESEERIRSLEKVFLSVFDGESPRLEALPYTLKHEDGTEAVHYWRTSNEPYLDEEGNVEYLLQFTEDITDQINLEKQQQILLDELNHRVKNLLNMTLSIARISGRKAASIPQYITDFTQRVNAMSRSHDRLYNNKWVGTSVLDIFSDVLSIVDRVGAAKITLSGPQFTLDANNSRDLSLFAHELTTNAVKYGCFSQPGGKLNVSWERRPDGLQIVWKESGLEGISDPKDLGFGSQLMNLVRSIKIDRKFEDDGIKVTMTLATHSVNSLV